MKVSDCQRGTTLIELMVVLVILGLIMAISSGTLRSNRAIPQSPDSLFAEFRLRAVQKRERVRVRYQDQWLLFLPDGQARGDGLDPMTGARVRNDAP